MKCVFLYLLLLILSNNAYTETRGVKHIVLCWLKDSQNPAHISTVMETSAHLESIELVDDIVVGRPLASDREIVDDSFDVGLVMNFRNRQDLDQYLVHKDHVRRVNDTLAPLCARIQVYDIAY